jgi:hypothetical protein
VIPWANNHSEMQHRDHHHKKWRSRVKNSRSYVDYK